MFNGDGFHTVGFQFCEQFGYARLDVVGNLGTLFLLAEVLAQGLFIVVQQFVGILVDVVELAEQIDGDILFHYFSFFLV